MVFKLREYNYDYTNCTKKGLIKFSLKAEGIVWGF